MLRFVHYSDVTWATYAVSTQHWQLDCLFDSSLGLMSKETSMVQYGEEVFFFFFYRFLSFISPVLPIIPPPPPPNPRKFLNFELPFMVYTISLQWKDTSRVRITGHSWVDSTDWFLLQRASNAESASISWCHHERCLMIMITTWYRDIIFITVVSMIIELRGFVFIHWIFMKNFGAIQIHA